MEDVELKGRQVCVISRDTICTVNDNISQDFSNIKLK